MQLVEYIRYIISFLRLSRYNRLRVILKESLVGVQKSLTSTMSLYDCDQ